MPDAPIIEVRTVEPIVIQREQLLREIDVRRLTGLSHGALYALMADGSFPLAFKLSERSVAWSAGEVLDWIRALPRTLVRPPPR